MILATALEFFVADRKDFIHHQNVGLHVDGDTESQTHIHSTRVMLDRVINKFPQPTEINNVLRGIVNFLATQAKNGSIETNILYAGHVRVKARTQFDESRQSTFGVDFSFGGAVDTGH